MDFFKTDIRFIKGVGEARAKAFASLGITDYESLLRHYPRTYIDHRNTTTIAGCFDKIGEYVTLVGLVSSAVSTHKLRGNMSISKVSIADETGHMQLTFFNNPYLKTMLRKGEQYLFYGKVEAFRSQISVSSPLFEPLPLGTTPKMRPVYPLTHGVTQKMLTSAIQKLMPLPEGLPDPLPRYIAEPLGLCTLSAALTQIHAPQSDSALAAAKKRLEFEELYYYLLLLQLIREKSTTPSAFVLPKADNSFVKLSPFTPTDAQARVMEEIRTDLSGGTRMGRLLQGDVGSGKTFVAGDAVWQMLSCGYQAAVMAPTAILASQHYAYFAPLLGGLGKKCALLISDMPTSEKRAVYAGLADGSIDFVVGTHALIQKEVTFKNLALVITDEQHRFGVTQRQQMSDKGRAPHILAMSATPIPRTMALIVYGDLDVSVIDELPRGRQEIKSFLVNSSYEARLYGFIEKELAAGGQVYFVCPLVEENEALDLTDVQKQTEALKKRFGEDAVAMLHGKMKGKEKDAIMQAFSECKAKILVSTTVIEVGINVPNATLMVIRNAERFGLSQLHQLRGRVGRGQKQSYCILLSDSKSKTARERLGFFVKTTDGFKIAEKDLSLRGPGDLVGARQSGESAIELISRGCDMRQLELARRAAHYTLEKDPYLKKAENAILCAQIEKMRPGM